MTNLSEMEKKTITWVVIGALFLVALFVVFKVGTLSGGTSGEPGKIDMTGWTANEKMNYEMHKTIPVRAQKENSPSGTGMVGGC